MSITFKISVVQILTCRKMSCQYEDSMPNFFLSIASEDWTLKKKKKKKNL